MAETYDQMKDFQLLYKERGAYHAEATGFTRWFLEDNYRAIARQCRPADAVLDLACGEGCLGPHLHVARLVGVDYSPRALDLNRQMFPGVYHELHLGDLRHLETVALPAASFDAAVCSLSLMYLLDADLARCLTAVHGLLVPGGRFVFTYPTVGARRSPSPSAAELAPAALRERLEAAGLGVEKMEPVCPLLPPEWVEASALHPEEIHPRYLAAREGMTLDASYHFLCRAARP